MNSNQNKLIVSPKQPYFVMATSRYYKAVVMNYGISHFYCFNNDVIGNSVIAVPDGCIDMLFCCDDKKPYASVCGTVLHPKIVKNERNYYFGIRFLPGLSLNLKNAAMSDFIENEIPFLEVIQDKELFDKITGSRDFNYQIQEFMKMYMKFYQKAQTTDKFLDLKNFMLKKINETAGQIKISELAEQAGYTVRYINKIFSEEFGLPPKIFCKLMRFQHLLSNLNEFDKNSFDANLAQLSIELGYYDQSHMIRDFYELTNTTPGKYIYSLKEKEYNKRLIVI
nr:helix-turn-helix domain-containing protein [uncultured Acetobacterium sp.]